MPASEQPYIIAALKKLPNCLYTQSKLAGGPHRHLFGALSSACLVPLQKLNKRKKTKEIKYIMEEIRKDRDFVVAELKGHGVEAE